MFADSTWLLADLASHAGEDFTRVLLVVLIVSTVLILLHFALSRRGSSVAQPRSRWNLWEKLIYLVTLGSVALLAVTSFGSMLRFGVLEGWALFAHMFGAGALVGILPLVAMTWSNANRFGQQSVRNRPPRFFWFSKAMFWILLAGGFVVTVTMLLSMLPFYGTDGLHVLLDIHRYSGLIVVVALLFHFYSVVQRRAVPR
jgi:hypothetical protein